MDNTSRIDQLAVILLELAQIHGKPATREKLVAGLPLEDNQLTPEIFHRAAERIELATRTVRKRLRDMPAALLPVVLLLEDNQSCLLLAVDDDDIAHVKFPDLIGEAVSVPLETLEQQYSGYCILARPKSNYDERAPKVFDQESGHWFWSAVRANLPVYRDVLFAALFINLFSLALPLYTMNVYDRIVPNRALESLWVLSIGIALIVFVDLGLKTMRGYFLDLAGRRVDVRLSTRIMEQVLGLRMEERPTSTGSFAANLHSFQTIRDFITSTTITGFIDIPFSVMFLIALAWIAPLMTIPLMVGIVAIVSYALIVRKPMIRLTETTYNANASRNATLIEALVGLDTLKALGAESIMQRRWEKSALFLARVGERLRLLSLSTINVTQWVQQWVSVSVIVLGVYLIADAQMSMGGLIAASMLTARSLSVFAQVAGLVGQYHHATTAITSLNTVMDKAVERPRDSNFLSRKEFDGAIEFKDVSLRYPNTDSDVIKNMSFKIEAGEHVGILGRIGSGKTSMQRLIMGLYQPTSGAVLIDHIDQRQLDPAELRQQIGYVPQEALLFNGTLKENLVLAHPEADDDAVIRAAHMAGLHAFVDGHPQGFDMMVGERGESLSGGQRKAVSFARAFVHDPSILVLDEPTGSMDHATEAWVQKQLMEFSNNRTMIVITHRTSLLDLVDRIIVVDAGQIVADGPKETVLEALRQGRIGRAA